MSKLKEINGRYYQECEVVMLATEKATWPNCIWLGRITNQLRLDTSYNHKPKSISPIDNSMIPQHFYFLSNEEVKEGDWGLLNGHTVTKCLGKSKNNSKSLTDWQKESTFKKIVATTDTSLSQTSRKEIPQPSKEFIQAFIKDYNEGKPITKVLVERESIGAYCNIEYLSDFKLKVNPSNEITIKKIKDSYTREELPSILQSYLDYCHFSGYVTPMKFIEENL